MMVLRRGLIALSIIAIPVLFMFSFHMKPSLPPTKELIAFSLEDFVDASTLSNTHQLAAENDTFELYIDETTSYFTVVNKMTGSTWQSNPTEKDPWELDLSQPITTNAIDRQKATLEIVYFNRAGAVSIINNYRFSISHPESVLSEAGERTYKIKYLESGFQVLYQIEDLEVDYLYFPKYLPKDVLEAMPQRGQLEMLAYTGFDAGLDAYEIVQYESMSRLVKNRLYQIFYVDTDDPYTRERAIEENFSYGYTEQYEKISFQIGVQILLNEEGVEVSIIKDSIVEPENVRLARISLYPMFGTAVSEVDGIPSEGYIVLPDGSGAVMEFNNGKHHQNPYRRRIYGADLSLMSYEMPEQQQKISIPLYGMVKEEAAFAAIITEGDAMATMQADVSGRVDSYNKAYVTFSLRESESVTLGSGYNRYGIDLWTEPLVASDFTIRYTFLEQDKANYVGIAEAYRNYLIEEKEFTPSDTTTATMLTAEIIGAYDRKDFILGVPYYPMSALTTYAQTKQIVDEMLARDVANINILYSGIMNGGLSNTVSDRANFERVLGRTRELNDLIDTLEALDIFLYPSVNFVSTKDYRRTFDRFRYTASRIQGSHAMIFNYHYPTRLPYSETPFEGVEDDYVINPLYYEAIFERFQKDYDYQHVALLMMGSRLGGHYDRENPLYRQDALAIQERLLASSNYKMMLSNPLGFGMRYADYIVDLPIETTLYAILDYQIPLLQLVLSGLIDYATPSLNMAHERSMEYKFLKVIETGSNVKYTLSFEPSRILIDTNYNQYMSIQYENWLDVIEQQVQELDALGIHEGRLINHERLANNVYRVTYSHGLTILINYNLTAVTIAGKTIGAMSYLEVEV